MVLVFLTLVHWTRNLSRSLPAHPIMLAFWHCEPVAWPVSPSYHYEACSCSGVVASRISDTCRAIARVASFSASCLSSGYSSLCRLIVAVAHSWVLRSVKFGMFLCFLSCWLMMKHLWSRRWCCCVSKCSWASCVWHVAVIRGLAAGRIGGSGCGRTRAGSWWSSWRIRRAAGVACKMSSRQGAPSMTSTRHAVCAWLDGPVTTLFAGCDSFRHLSWSMNQQHSYCWRKSCQRRPGTCTPTKHWTHSDNFDPSIGQQLFLSGRCLAVSQVCIG